ncbi:MAG: GxxExxY protein [Gemmatimonadetes bacterium]|nr:GxxExxY protein [Gemmatimonadota bacterium]
MGRDPLTEKIIGAAIAVHHALGPGLLESTYHVCMAHELMLTGLRFERQKAVPVRYRGARLDCGYRIDFLIENEVLVELKSVERLDAIHTARVLTYLKLSGLHTGLLINFNVHLLRDGIRRLVSGNPTRPHNTRS